MKPYYITAAARGALFFWVTNSILLGLACVLMCLIHELVYDYSVKEG